MNEIESRPTPGSTTPMDTMQQQLQQLRTLLVWTLLTVVLLSASLNFYLWRQFVYINKDLKSARQQMLPMIAEYEKTTLPAMRDFVSKLNDYARTHPDFKPILSRYNIQTDPTPLATGSAPIPAPKK